jgi:hypothetical protein
MAPVRGDGGNEMKDTILNNIQIPDKFSLDGIEPHMIQWRNQNKPLLTIHADGRITVAEHLSPTETAAAVLQIMREQWLADAQATKIREQEDHIKRLEHEIELFREHADYEDVCLVEAILKGEEIGRKENQQ